MDYDGDRTSDDMHSMDWFQLGILLAQRWELLSHTTPEVVLVSRDADSVQLEIPALRTRVGPSFSKIDIRGFQLRTGITVFAGYCPFVNVLVLREDPITPKDIERCVSMFYIKCTDRFSYGSEN